MPVEVLEFEGLVALGPPSVDPSREIVVMKEELVRLHRLDSQIDEEQSRAVAVRLGGDDFRSSVVGEGGSE